MRSGNLLLVVVCGAAVGVAAAMAWRWRDLPVLVTRVPEVGAAGASSLDAIRTLACMLSAGFVSGLLVVGLGGRLVMRILAATSGDGVQGLVTEAGETVGAITLSGSISFLIFVGILVPLAAALLFVPLRWVLPNRAWIAGLAFGVILLGFFGVTDPLEPDSVDFIILGPPWLAVTLVSATALLFGMTLAALAARLNATLPSPPAPWSALSWRHRAAYSSLICLLNPVLVLPAALYVAGRAVSHGRLGALLENGPLRQAGRVVAAAVVIAALAMVVGATADIV